jgi:AbrB family looped-hinge helix DNA binding protein
MGVVTSNLQVTIPKAIADRYGIHPGDALEWVEAGESIRVIVVKEPLQPVRVAERLQLFDEATERRRQREATQQGPEPSTSRGWTREALYDRGFPR